MEPTISLEKAADRIWDVAVVGAGPAGSMAAGELARLGLSVLLLDKSPFPRWKPCGCCLNPWGQSTLAAAGLGELPTRLGGIALSRFELSFFSRRVELDIPHSISISREALDAALVQAAIDAGAQFIPEALAQLVPGGLDHRLLHIQRAESSFTIRAALVLAADGLAGRLVAAEPEGKVSIGPQSRVGAGVIIDSGPPQYEKEIIYMACGGYGYVGLVRLEDGRLNAGAALDPEAVRFQGGLGPAAAAILRESGFPEIENLEKLHWRGTAPLTRRMREVAGRRWMTLGDAAGYVEPFTGEGIAWALAQGRAVAPIAAAAARGWSPEASGAWTRAYHQLMDERQRHCRMVAGALRHPAWTGWLIGAMAHFPKAAEPLIRKFSFPKT